MRSGFSLVELSIVLVILGLLTGGILTGQTLIRAAELRAVTTEYQNFQSATQTFRDRYFGVPGDLRNAASFWPGQAANGNGDGNVDGATAANANGENFQFWRHLTNAGLLEGNYAGSAVGGIDGAVFAQNVPRSKLSNAGWGVFNDDIAGHAGVTGEFTNPEYGDGFSFGAAVANAPAMGPALVPEEAWNIDTKVDDGQPSQGAVIGYPFTDTQCADSTGATDGTANYQLDNEATTCALIFARQF